MDSKTLREKYLQFFERRGHKRIDPAPLVLKDDPSTLFTSSGMQPLVPYLLGEEHPAGKRLVDSQPSFRAEDILEVGDNRHTTFFEMLGNWSLGDYFKKEQLNWFWEFLTKELNLDPDRLHVSIFGGNEFVEKDEETFNIWKTLGVSEDHIYFYGVEKNWWSKSGTPDKMPIGEIGGSDSEVFYDFGTPHNPEYGKECHPNCDCGRFLEIGNSVFIEYKKIGNGKFEKLPKQNVDFGGGLERLTAASDNNPDIFQTDLYAPIIQTTVEVTGKEYSEEYKSYMRVIADHMKAATFLIFTGVVPSNKLQGYVLRRLLRRSAVKFYQITKDMKFLSEMIKVYETILSIYDDLFGIDKNNIQVKERNYRIIFDEMDRFGKSLATGFHLIDKIKQIDGKAAFDLYQSYGFPYEVTEELFRLKGQEIDKEQFRKEFEKHRELSRTASAGIFKGGLAGHSEIEIKYHTATHLLHQALRDVLGPEVFQKGSNINPERLRFDFSFYRKMTDGEIKKTEELVNQKIKEDLKVDGKTVSLEEAKELNAIGLFNEKYGNEVSLYGIGPNYKLDPSAKDQRDRSSYYSLEFCGGPHVEQTGAIGKIVITKAEAVSSGVRRIRMQFTR